MDQDGVATASGDVVEQKTPAKTKSRAPTAAGQQESIIFTPGKGGAFPSAVTHDDISMPEYEDELQEDSPGKQLPPGLILSPNSRQQHGKGSFSTPRHRKRLRLGAMYQQSPGHKAGSSPGQHYRRSKQAPNDSPALSPALSPAPTSFTLRLQVPAASGEAYQQLSVCWAPGVMTIKAPERTHTTLVTSSGASCSSGGCGSYTIGRTYNLHFNQVVISAEASTSPPHSPISPCPLTAAAKSPASSKQLPPFSSTESSQLAATQGQDAADAQQLVMTAAAAAAQDPQPMQGKQASSSVSPGLSISTLTDCVTKLVQSWALPPEHAASSAGLQLLSAWCSWMVPEMQWRLQEVHLACQQGDKGRLQRITHDMAAGFCAKSSPLWPLITKLSLAPSLAADMLCLGFTATYLQQFAATQVDEPSTVTLQQCGNMAAAWETAEAFFKHDIGNTASWVSLLAAKAAVDALMQPGALQQ